MDQEDAFLEASERGDVHKLSALLEREPKLIAATDRYGKTALHMAATEGSLEAVKLLLDRGALVDAKDKDDQRTPLHFAAENGRLELVSLLLARGAKVNSPDYNQKYGWGGETPLHRAAERDRRAVVQFLLTKVANIGAKSKSGVTPLHFAGPSVIQLLVACGANVDAADIRGTTPLHNAISDWSKVRLLLWCGADIDAIAIRKAASVQGSPKDLRVLMGDREGLEFCSLLYKAPSEADIKRADELLKLRPDLAVSGDYDWGETPLHVAAKYGYEEMAKLLLANEADVNGKGQSRTPLHLAVENGHARMVKLLLEHGAKADAKALRGTCFRGRAEIAEFLLAAGSKANATDEEDQTALHDCGKYGHDHVDLARVLLAHSADPNSRDREGKTPLHIAAYYGSREVARLLLAHNADPSIADKAGKTPMEAARDGYSDYCWEVSELLLGSPAATISLKCRGCRATYVPGQDATSMTSRELMRMMPGMIREIPSGLMIGRAKSPDPEQLRRDLVTILSLGPRGGWTCECNKDNPWQPKARRHPGATRRWWRLW